MKKNRLCLIILYKSIFYCIFLFVFAKVCVFCCHLIVGSDDLTVFSPSRCQVTTRNYIFSVYVVCTNF